MIATAAQMETALATIENLLATLPDSATKTAGEAAILDIRQAVLNPAPPAPPVDTAPQPFPKGFGV